MRKKVEALIEKEGEKREALLVNTSTSAFQSKRKKGQIKVVLKPPFVVLARVPLEDSSLRPHGTYHPRRVPLGLSYLLSTTRIVLVRQIISAL